MNTKTLKLSESEAFLKSISIRTIKDVRALDLDLLLVLNNGDRIIITGGAMHALNAPEMALQFADGQLPLARMFEQIERIDVSPEANLTVSSKEITRYNQNNARVRKSKTEDEDGDKPIVLDKGERNPAASSDSNGVGGNSEDFNFAPVRAADHQKQLADAEINSNKESDKNWGVQWPIAACALALLAAAGGGGGGSNGGNGGNGGSANRSGGSGGAAGAAGSGSVEPPQATLSGAVALGPIRNANITAYDDRGNLLSATTEIVDGRYALTLNRPFYKGIMLLVVRDNTPGAADNYLDEASLRMVDLGSTPLRSLVVANGVAQTVNVTALTELAVIRAGLAQGLTNPAQAPQLSETLVSNANAAVGNLFKVDIIGAQVADGTSGNMTAADALAQVSDDLLAAGVDVHDDTLLGNAVVSAIDAVNYSSIATPARLQALVDAYARILAEANEAEPQAGQDYANKDTVPDSTLGSDPAIEDFTAIGASLPGLTAPHGADPVRAAHLALLDDALKYKARTQVDSVAEINQLGDAVHRFIETAGQSADALNAALTPATRAQWEKSAQILGITGVDIHPDEGNLEQILTSLASKRPDEIDGIKKIQGLIDGINAALKVIGDYADQSSNPAPTVEDYTSAGILTPDRQPLVTHDNLAAINAAIDKLTRKDVDTRGKIKTVVTAYRTLLDAADGNMDNDSGQALTAPHYLSIGVPLEQLGIVTLRADRKTIETVNQPPLDLLNSVIGSRNKAAIDTPDKITALARTAADLIRTRASSTGATAPHMPWPPRWRITAASA